MNQLNLDNEIKKFDHESVGLHKKTCNTFSNLNKSIEKKVYDWTINKETSPF